MKAIILALALTLVGCQQKTDQSVLTTDKVLLYDYEFEVQIRMSEHGFSSAGLKAKCKAEIGNVQDRKFLKVNCFEGLDYNGVYPWSKFFSSPKLTTVFQEHLKNVILTFQYRNGHVDDLMVPEHVSEFALNICKGILNLYENTIKKDQKTYHLKENGIEGMCDTTYLLQNTEKPDEFLVTKTKDLTNCDNMARKVVGAAYVIPCEFCRQKNRNFQGTRTYNYRMKDLKERDEKIILQATVQEIQQFTPFREETGETIIMEARQKLEFIEAHTRLPEIPSVLKKHDSLLYSFKNSPQLPVPLSKIRNINKEIEDGLHYLANENFPKDGKRFLQLVNLLRTEKEINYSEVFDPYYRHPMYRAVVLDLIAAAGTSVGLRYVRHKIVRQEITTIEAAQTLLVFFHYANAFEEVVEEAMAIMIEVLKGPQSLYRTTTCLAYGSLLSRFYAISDTIQDKYLKPLTDFATKAKRSSDIDASVLALKTFGNVRHSIVLKPIMKYLQTALPFDTRIQQNAIMALRNPAKKDPIRVQGILLPIIKNYKITPLIRTCAAFVLLESKPNFSILMTVANAMLHEPSIQVENFVFMYLSTIAGSRSPEFRVMGPAYRMALKVLTEKSQKWAGHSASRYSLIEYFDEFYKARLGMYSMFLHEEENMQATFTMTHFKALFMGSLFSPFETGVQIQKIKEIVDVPQGHDSQQLQKTPSDQKFTIEESVVLEVYAKIFDQEIVTGYMRMERIRQLLQVSDDKRHLPWIKYFTDVLKNLPNIYWQKYFMSAEIQRIVPTCAGVPWQIGLVHIAHTKVAGNVQLLITPEPQSQFTWLNIINSDIKLKTRLRLQMNKDMILSMGIITPEINAVLEKKATVTANVPINMDVAMNIKEKSFKLELPPCKEEIDIISLRLKTSAITSNIEETAAALSTPVFYPGNLSRTMMDYFDRSSKKGDERKDTLPSEKKAAENVDAQLEKYLQSFHETSCFEACTFGCKACLHWADMYAGHGLRRSLYNYIGEYVFKFFLKESDPNVPIEKLRFTLQGGARVAEQMVHLLRNEEMDLIVEKMKKIFTDGSDERTESSSSSDSQEKVLKKIIDLKQVLTSQQQDNEQEEQLQQNHPLKKKQQLNDTSSSSSSSSSDTSSSSSDDSESTQNDKHINGRHQKEKSHPRSEKDGDKKKRTKRPAEQSDEKEPGPVELGDLNFREGRIDQSGSPLPYSEASSRNDSSWQEEEIIPGGVLLPYVTVVLEAVRSDNEKQGYSVSMYKKRNNYNVYFKIVASKFNDMKWRTCLDSLLRPLGFQYSLSWGHECKDNRIEAKLSEGQVAIYKAIQFKVKWTKHLFVQQYYRFRYLFPAIAYHFGFFTIIRNNPENEIILRVIEKAPEHHVAIIKVPGRTMYNDDFFPDLISSGTPRSDYQNPKFSRFNVALWLSRGVEAVCEVQDEIIKTFDNKKFNTNIPERECNLLIVKDCTTSDNYEPNFQIWIQYPKPGVPKEIHITINVTEIIIQDSSGMLNVLHNEAPKPINKEANIEIFKTTNNVNIKAAEYGLESVTYDGVTLKIKTSAKMQGNTCGLCGDYNGAIKHEYLISNQADTEEY